MGILRITSLFVGLWGILSSLGCVQSGSVTVLCDATTEGGVQFSVLRQETWYGRRLAYEDRLHLTGFPTERKSLTNETVVVRENAADYLGFELRSKGSRVWLVRPDRREVFAAADMETGEIYPTWKQLPGWAMVDSGKVIQPGTEQAAQPNGR